MKNNCASSSLFTKNVPRCTVNRTQNIFLETNSSSESKGIPLNALHPSGFPPVLWKHLFSPNTALGYGYIGARTDTTQQSGQTPDKEVEIKNITVYVSGYSETDTTGMLSPPTVWRFSVAADINSNVFDFYFLIWSLSRLLCCVGSGSNVAAALGPSYLVLLDFTTLSTT